MHCSNSNKKWGGNENKPSDYASRKILSQGQADLSKTDLKGAVTYANDAFVGLSGFSWEELIG